MKVNLIQSLTDLAFDSSVRTHQNGLNINHDATEDFSVIVDVVIIFCHMITVLVCVTKLLKHMELTPGYFFNTSCTLWELL